MLQWSLEFMGINWLSFPFPNLALNFHISFCKKNEYLLRQDKVFNNEVFYFSCLEKLPKGFQLKFTNNTHSVTIVSQVDTQDQSPISSKQEGRFSNVA